jgi:hypothetical protein
MAIIYRRKKTQPEVGQGSNRKQPEYVIRKLITHPRCAARFQVLFLKWLQAPG